MGILTYGKFVLTGVIVGGVAWSAATVTNWRLSGKIEKLKGQVEQVTVARDDYLAKLITCSQSLDKTLGALATQNAEVEKEHLRAESLRRANQEAARKISGLEAERRMWQARPYPEDCEEAVREFAKRAGARP